MDTQEILKKIAVLESVNDQLSTELEQVDRLLRVTGFPDGIASAKSVAQELIADGMDALDCEF